MPHMESQCWEWTSTKSKTGYGVFAFGYNRARAHRVSVFLLNGEIPDGMMACHACDNRACVNPAHLFTGTPSDNILDASSKCRMARGESNGGAKLTADNVIEIRSRYAAGGIGQTALAREFGVDQTAISHLILRKNWKHL